MAEYKLDTITVKYLQLDKVMAKYPVSTFGTRNKYDGVKR